MDTISLNDKMLRAVLLNDELMQKGGYDSRDCMSIYQALSSDNYIVRTVAKIIDGASRNKSDNEIYKEISDYLKQKV